jgi:AbrB family looped-hinge helix DNA binding protein
MPSHQAHTRLTTKGQVVIPQPIRSRLAWKPGTRLRVVADEKDRSVTLSLEGRAHPSAWLGDIAGCVRRGDPVADLEAEHRTEVERDARRRP